MIVAGIVGGLASQLHKYAMARSLADELGLDLKLDIRCYNENFKGSNESRSYELGKFKTRALPASNFEIVRSRGYLEPLAMKIINSFVGKTIISDVNAFKEIVREQLGSNCYYPDITKESTSFLYESIARSKKENLYISGEWGFGADYLSRHRHSLINDLQPVEQLSDKGIYYLNLLQSRNAIACHIRRGDYVDSKFHALYSENYYISGINYLLSKKPDSNILIFSDDLIWAMGFASKFFPEKSVLIDGCQAWEDFHLMSKCNDYVISASGFSSMAAWLCDYEKKIVVAPKKWVNNDELNPVFMNQFPVEWIFL